MIDISWPTGQLGDLLIGAGQTSQFPPGLIYDYSSITVEAGGTLEILPGVGWTIFGVSGDFTLRGSLVDRNHEHFGGSWTIVAPDNHSLSATLPQGDGGAGGDFLGCGNGHVLDQYAGRGGNPSGFPTQGNGGGGGTLSPNGNGGNGTSTSGGNGATPSAPPGELGPGGIGGSGFSSSGQDGGSVSGGTNMNYQGGGGGGGTRGRHGGLLYLCILGKLEGAGGTIDLSGEAGGSGGNGGSAARGGGAGGGGGGAGGDGGVLVLRFKTGFAPPTFAVHAGAAGRGGSGGVNHMYGLSACGGKSGQDGQQGKLDISQIG